MHYICYRGEGTEGYSESLRQLEFTSAFRAEIRDYLTTTHEDTTSLNTYMDSIQFHFQDALTYHGPIYEDNDETTNDEFDGAEPIPRAQVSAYESAMQYITISIPSSSNNVSVRTLSEIYKATIERCSLIRTSFEIVASGESYGQIATKALDNNSFNDITKDGSNEHLTWSIRLRRYGPMQIVENKSSTKRNNRQARYGKNVRSPLRDERKAILEMKELVQTFAGKVDLTDPQCRIYLLEGLRHCNMISGSEGDKLLARVVAKGPKTSIYRPNTRICVTTTPLCPIASFTLCNIAQIQRRGNCTILDPFAGSCATLLAAAHITTLPTTSSSSDASTTQQSSQGGCRSVAIEIAHNGFVNRDDIIKDFETRSLPPPIDIIRGDCTSSEIRYQARLAIGGGAFDFIVTDPPYGIREAMSSGEESDDLVEGSTETISPLTQLFHAMGQDISNGTPLLKQGGRLVAFIPVQKGQSLEDCLPDSNARDAAHLVMEGRGKEQVLR